jgi:hypothetical protein
MSCDVLGERERWDSYSWIRDYYTNLAVLPGEGYPILGRTGIARCHHLQ